MSYRIVPSKRFLKAMKKYATGGKRYLLEAAEEAIHLLSLHDDNALRTLTQHWHDHELKGNKQGIRELHIGADDLILYRTHAATSTIELLDIVSHEELRNN